MRNTGHARMSRITSSQKDCTRPKQTFSYSQMSQSNVFERGKEAEINAYGRIHLLHTEVDYSISPKSRSREDLTTRQKIREKFEAHRAMHRTNSSCSVSSYLQLMLLYVVHVNFGAVTHTLSNAQDMSK